MRAAALGLLLLAAAPLAAEPPARRFALGGEALASLAPHDDGYFNETDYDRNALRTLRLSLTAAWRPHQQIALLAEGRQEGADAPELRALYLRLRPLRGKAFDLQAGRIPPVFGAFSRRRYASDGPLVGYPLAYQYLLALRPDAAPATPADLARMRGLGWLPFFPVGSRARRAGLPLASALRWDTGVEARLLGHGLEAAAALTVGSLGNPRVRDDNGGKQLSGRLAWQPSPAFLLGASAARGAYASDELLAALPAGAPRALHQTALGADAEFSRGRLLCRAEAVRATWELPLLEGPESRARVTATAAGAEAAVRLRPGLQAGARGERLWLSPLPGGAPGQDWEAPVWRLEAAAARAFGRHLRLKLGYQYDWRDGGYVRREGFPVAQLAGWF